MSIGGVIVKLRLSIVTISKKIRLIASIGDNIPTKSCIQNFGGFSILFSLGSLRICLSRMISRSTLISPLATVPYESHILYVQI